MTDQQTTNNARRERYAAALSPMEHFIAADGYPSMAMRTADELAGAAMAVADEEQRAMLPTARNALEAMKRENERLRADLEQQKKLRAIAEERHLTASERADEALAAVVRIREYVETTDDDGIRTRGNVLRILNTIKEA